MDLKFWLGVGVALVSLYPEISNGVRILLAVIGAALIFVSVATWLLRFLQKTPGSGARAEAPGARGPRGYSRDKIEALRAAAGGLRDVCWNATAVDAEARLRAFHAIANEFDRQPEFRPLLRRIDAAATRLMAMSRFPPFGATAPDPSVRQQLLQDGLDAIEELLGLTDQWAIFDQKDK